MEFNFGPRERLRISSQLLIGMLLFFFVALLPQQISLMRSMLQDLGSDVVEEWEKQEMDITAQLK